MYYVIAIKSRYPCKQDVFAFKVTYQNREIFKSKCIIFFIQAIINSFIMLFVNIYVVYLSENNQIKSNNRYQV